MKEKESEDHFGFSNLFIKKTVHFYISPLTNFINRFILNGCFLAELKITKVIPVHKKGNLNEPNNYRPIALVPVLSKIPEKIVAHLQLHHLEKINLIIESQLRYREGYGGVDAVCKLVL